jgi:Spy/CpxP family protein refolding chaperone
MNRKNLLADVAAVGLTAAAPYMVQAQPVPEQGQRKDPIDMYVQAGATPEQQAKIRALAKEFEVGARIKIERAGNLLRKIQNFSLEPMPDEKAVLATQTEFNNLQADVATSRIKLMLQIRSILNDEQRLKLVQMLKEQQAPQPQQGM